MVECVCVHTRARARVARIGAAQAPSVSHVLGGMYTTLLAVGGCEGCLPTLIMIVRARVLEQVQLVLLTRNRYRSLYGYSHTTVQSSVVARGGARPPRMS